MYAARDLENPAVIVDANHSNSGKQYLEQIRIVKEVLHSCHHSADVKKLVKGVMIESYIEPGKDVYKRQIFYHQEIFLLNWHEIHP